MRLEKIYLEDIFGGLPVPEKKTEVTLYIPDLTEEIDTEKKFPCTVICPGGGYWWTSDREADPVALRMVGNGIAAAVVRYTCGGAHYPMQMLQILAAITYISTSTPIKLRSWDFPQADTLPAQQDFSGRKSLPKKHWASLTARTSPTE